MQSVEIIAALHNQQVDNKIAEITRENAELKKRMDAWDADRQRFFIWGILALGAAVVALGSYIWTHIPGGKL